MAITLPVASAVPLPPPLWHPPRGDNSREGNTAQSQSEGEVQGDMHGPPLKQVLYKLLKTQDFP